MPVGLGKIYFFSEYGYRFLLFSRVMHFIPLKWCIWFHRLVAIHGLKPCALCYYMLLSVKAIIKGILTLRAGFQSFNHVFFPQLLGLDPHHCINIVK